MSEREKSKGKSHTHFWRACKYLIPYQRMVLVSVICAFFVGLATTGGLGTMLPIMRVLINGDTVQAWLYRQSVEDRLGVKFVQDPDKIQMMQVIARGPAARAGIKPGDVIEDAQIPPDAPASPFRDDSRGIYRAAETLRRIAWTDGRPSQLTITGRPVTAQISRPHWYTLYAMRLVEMLPIKPFHAVIAVFGILAVITIVGNGIRYFQEHLSDKAAILAVNDIRRQLYDRVLHIPLRFFGQQGTSDVTSRLIADAANLQDGFKTVLGQSIQEPIKAAMALGLALVLSWKLTVFIVLFAPLMVTILRKFGKKMRRASRAALETSSSMLGQVEGTLIGIRVVKGASAERFERRRYMKIMGSLVDEQLKMSRIDAISSPVLESLTTMIAGVIMICATYMVLVSGTLKPEVFILVMISLVMIADSLRRFSKVNNALQKANAAAARIFETMDAPVERRRTFNIAAAGDTARGNGKAVHAGVPSLCKLPTLQHEIRFEELSFTYPHAGAAAIDGIDLTVPRGQSVAIVGRNGSGKTTLLALLPRFYDPQSGRITIDGVDIRTGTLSSLRKQISIVTQDSVIFAGTIAENIAYGNPVAGREYPDSPARRELMADVEQAARRAFAHDFILEKPQGYNTMLGGMGGQLSGGQKQRVCIARAILRKSPILILDEATSQVDTESEHLIQQAIEGLMHERTTFVIAHRFSTIVSADTIVVMERGKIVGQGKHDELLRTCDIYQQLCERQIFSTNAK